MGRSDAGKESTAVEWLDGPAGAAGGDELVLGRPGARRLGTRGWTILALVAAVIAGGLWFWHRPQRSARIGYAGRPVDGAGRVLDRADAAFARYATAHHAALGRPARCYFGRVGGRSGTDVGATLFCGPVLFYGGVAPADYLRYPLSRSGAAHGHLKLTAADRPVPPTPQLLPAGVQLVRADGRTAPRATVGPRPPPPPPAPVDALLRVTRTDLPGLVAAPATAVIGSRNVQLTLKAYGVIARYGHGSRARSAPAGERLIGFEVEVGPGEIGSLSEAEEQPSLGISVDGEPARRLPLGLGVSWSGESWTRFLVAAVGARARGVDLVVHEAGITQRLSLLTGTPAAGNIAVLARDPRTRFGEARAHGPTRARVRGGGTEFSTRLRLDLSTPSLGYFSPYGREHASGPGRALLDVALSFDAPELPCPGSTCGEFFGAANLRLLVAGGPSIGAVELPGSYAVFEVPASFHSGTVIVSGSARTGMGWSVTLAHPFRVSVTFPSE